MASKQICISGLPDGFNDAAVSQIFGPYGEISWAKVMGKGKGKGKKALVEFQDAADSKWLVENLNGNIPEGLETAVQVEFSTSKGAGKADAGAGKGDAGKGSFGKAAGGKNGAAAAATPYGKAAGKGGKFDKGGKGSDGGKGGKSVMQGLIKGAQIGGYIASVNVKGVTEPGPDSNCCYVKGLPSDCTNGDLYELFAPFGAIPSNGVLAQHKGEGNVIGFVDFCDEASTHAAIEALNGFTNEDGSICLQITQKRAGGGKAAGKGKDKGKDKGKGKGKFKGKW